MQLNPETIPPKANHHADAKLVAGREILLGCQPEGEVTSHLRILWILRNCRSLDFARDDSAE